VLKGLEASHVGMLIAAPEMGKSHLCFSIAIEHSTQFRLLGLSASTKTQKTLLISAEDSISVIKKQLTQKLAMLPTKIRKLARDNIYPFSTILPLVTPTEASNQEQAAVQAYTEKLIELIKEKGISLVVIDTVSEVIGNCDEVKHDRIIKTAFQRIARESGAAVLLVHHVNKAEIKGESEVSMASGAGLTTVMRLSKLIMGITSRKSGKRLNFLKANYLTQDERMGFGLDFDGVILVNTELGVELSGSDMSQAPVRPEPLVVKAERKPSEPRDKKRSSIRGAF
jgi:RecA-family ATPase